MDKTGLDCDYCGKTMLEIGNGWQKCLSCGATKQTNPTGKIKGVYRRARREEVISRKVEKKEDKGENI